MPRLFLAVSLPAPLRESLVALQHALAAQASGVRWASADTLHLTVRFIGEDDAERVAEAVGPIVAAVPAFAVEVGGAGCFGGGRRPGVLWVGAAPAAPLAALAAAVATALGPPDQPFRPHITIGRFRRGQPPDLAAVGRLGSLPVDALTLTESRLRPDGPEHLARAVLPLLR